MLRHVRDRLQDHPDLRRILLYDSFVGYPLRKDYPVDRRQPIVEEIDPVAIRGRLALTQAQPSGRFQGARSGYGVACTMGE